MNARCNKCGHMKTADEMGRNKLKKSGLHHWCLACRRANNNERNRSRAPEQRSAIYRRQRYGLSPAEHAEMLHRQGGLCAICKVKEASCVDHCHDSGQVRGLLCKGCNTLLRALDNWPHRDAAEAYLATPPARNGMQAVAA